MIPLKDDNPTRSTPLVTWALIVGCVLVFVWQASLPPAVAEAMVYAFGLVPGVLFGQLLLPPELDVVPAWMTIFSSMFLHGGWAHLIGNMLYLWIFGDNVEDDLGKPRFVLFYLACGVAAAMAQALPDPSSPIPMVGASGAISGVLGAYLVLHGRAQVLVLIPFGLLTQVVRLPAVMVLGFWFLIQLVSELGAGDAAGVAFRAHIGGFVAGLMLAPLMAPRRR